MTRRDWQLDSLHKYEAYEEKLVELLPFLDKLDEAHALLNQGISRAEVSNNTGIGYEVLRRLWPELRLEHGVWKRSSKYTVVDDSSKKLLSEIEAMLDDGASYREVMRTLPIHYRTLRKYFPGRGWTPQQAGQFGVTMMRMGKVLR